MSKQAPIVAELGRPETPAETAQRKAASSAAYRSSQTFRNLIAALIVTVAVVAVVIFAVPRGEPVDAPVIDIDAVAAEVTSTMERPVLVPGVPDNWIVNGAELKGGAVTVWDVVVVPPKKGFIHIAQAFDADVSWAPQKLNGIAATDSIRIGGLDWDVFDIRDPGATANVSHALGTQAGDDYILLYGSLGKKATADLAADLAPQIRSLPEDR